jgi:coproporphyrinogen III oxidase
LGIAKAPFQANFYQIAWYKKSQAGQPHSATAKTAGILSVGGVAISLFAGTVTMTQARVLPGKSARSNWHHTKGMPMAPPSSP